MSELKRPASSYILFCNDHRAEVKTQLGDNAKPKDVQKELSKLWNAASEAEKNKYKKLYEENKADYDKKAEALKVVEEDKEEQESSGRKLRKRPPKKVSEEEPKKKKKSTKEKAEPKPRGVTGYNLYMKENKEKLKSDKLEGKKLTEKVRKMWKELSDDEKKKYNERASKLAPEKKDEGSASDE
ncbi:hypothetical protein C9374_011041 [Naegleria lovaniensis]|uniref:HMG box domain-containing protein n=1 Tax=Naegleria lovaniensis TaxID=51637 RepID=A0AA88GGK3_NAELO|nr:uncharacterized protein C9374_011041 [Naegleria lovaniensis]KAG2374204.1 hypothetical protein C9374_011041 [Naegleria lovaniensis]